MNDRVVMTATALPRAHGDLAGPRRSPNALLPTLMSAGDRLAEVADLLALALVRLRSRDSAGIRGYSVPNGENLAGLQRAPERASESDVDCLEKPNE